MLTLVFYLLADKLPKITWNVTATKRAQVRFSVRFTPPVLSLDNPSLINLMITSSDSLISPQITRIGDCIEWYGDKEIVHKSLNI